MCRLALFNKQFVQDNPGYVVSMLDSLESSLGGDGNGIAVLADTHVEVLRGAYVSIDEIMHFINVWHSAQWFCFHTRRATTAPLGLDELCQPFYSKEKRLALCHVGTVNALDKWSVNGAPVSDGFMVNELATKYSVSPLEDLLRSGVGNCAGFYQEHPFVVADYRVYANTSETGGFLFSSHPFTVPGYERGEIYREIWVPGRAIRPVKEAGVRPFWEVTTKSDYDDYLTQLEEAQEYRQEGGND